MHPLKEEYTVPIALELMEQSSETASEDEFLILAISAGIGNGWNFHRRCCVNQCPCGMVWNVLWIMPGGITRSAGDLCVISAGFVRRQVGMRSARASGWN